MDTPDELRSAGSLGQSGKDSATTPDATADTTQEVQQLRSEISETQAQLQSTVAEIQERLSPSHLKEQATSAVRDATVGRVENMMNRVGDTVEQARETTRQTANTAAAEIRSNPIPYALIAAGTVWLLAGHRSPRRSIGQSRDSGWPDRRADYGSAHDYSTMDTTAGLESGEGSSSAVRSGVERAKSGLADAQQRLDRAVQQTRTRWDSLMDDNPLVVGIAALAAGAIVGAVIPSTHVEDRYMGEARESLVDSARDVAQSAVQTVTGSETNNPQGT